MRFDISINEGTMEEKELVLILRNGGDVEIDSSFYEEDADLPPLERRIYWTVGVRAVDGNLYKICKARDGAPKQYKNLAQLLTVLRRAKPSLREIHLPLYPGI